MLQSLKINVTAWLIGCVFIIPCYGSQPASLQSHLLQAKEKFLIQAGQLATQWQKLSNPTVEQKKYLQRQIQACAVEFIQANIQGGLEIEQFFSLSHKNEAQRAHVTQILKEPKGKVVAVAHKVESPMDFFDFFSQSVFVHVPYEAMITSFYKQAHAKLNEGPAIVQKTHASVNQGHGSQAASSAAQQEGQDSPSNVDDDVIDSAQRDLKEAIHKMEVSIIQSLYGYIHRFALPKTEYLNYIKKLIQTKQQLQVGENDEEKYIPLIGELELLFASRQNKKMSFEDFALEIYDKAYQTPSSNAAQVKAQAVASSATPANPMQIDSQGTSASAQPIKDDPFKGVRDLPVVYETFQRGSREALREYLQKGQTVDGLTKFVQGIADKMEKNQKVDDEKAKNFVFALQACHAARKGKKIPFIQYVGRLAITEQEIIKKEKDAKAKEGNRKKQDEQIKRNNEKFDEAKNHTTLRYFLKHWHDNVQQNKKNRVIATKKMDASVQIMIQKIMQGTMYRWQANAQEITQNIRVKEVKSVLQESQQARAFHAWHMQAQQNQESRHQAKIKKRDDYVQQLIKDDPTHIMMLHRPMYTQKVSRVIQGLDLAGFNENEDQILKMFKNEGRTSLQEVKKIYAQHEFNRETNSLKEHLQSTPHCKTCKTFGIAHKK